MSVQVYWADLPAPAFDTLPSNTIAVLPLGAVEQHGPHLPLSVDCDLTEATATRMLGALEPDQSVLVMPTISITKSNEHQSFSGTLALRAETLLAVLRDIGASVARAGIERLVFFNGHGGNTAILQIAARELRIEHDLIVLTCSWSGFAEFADQFDPAEYARDLHAGDAETSAMLATRPDLVDMGKARNFRTVQDRWEKDYRWIGLNGQAASPAWTVKDLNPEGVCGNAGAATARKGAALLDSAGKNFAACLREFARFDHRSGRE